MNYLFFVFLLICATAASGLICLFFHHLHSMICMSSQIGMLSKIRKISVADAAWAFEV